MKDLFDKIYKSKGPLGKWAEVAEGYFVFPKIRRSNFKSYEIPR